MVRVNLDDVITGIEEACGGMEVYFLPEENQYAFLNESSTAEERREIERHVGRVVPLPDKREVNEYRMMQDFIEGVETDAKRWLENAIVGKGAFHRFKVTCERFGLLNDWYDYREGRIALLAERWCEENAFEYEYMGTNQDEDDYEDEAEEEEAAPIVRRESPVRIVEINEKNAYAVGYMVSLFRIALAKLEGRKAEEDLSLAKEEVEYYLKKQYPIYAASIDGRYVGYAVCKTEDDVAWLESIYVRSEYRRKGIGRKLFERCEEVARELGNDTLYVNIHPNNELMISLLNEMGYNVLNLIEVRKKYADEEKKGSIQVGNHSYRY